MSEREPYTLRQIRWLHEQYRKMNRRYWGSALPIDIRIIIVPAGRTGYSIDCRYKVSGNIEEGMTTSLIDDTGNHLIIPIIELNELMMTYPPFAKIVLLHEMVHVAGIGGHGKPFKAELDRIAKLGAVRELLV